LLLPPHAAIPTEASKATAAHHHLVARISLLLPLSVSVLQDNPGCSIHQTFV
jgi:hypothetical protein